MMQVMPLAKTTPNESAREQLPRRKRSNMCKPARSVFLVTFLYESENTTIDKLPLTLNGVRLAPGYNRDERSLSHGLVDARMTGYVSDNHNYLNMLRLELILSDAVKTGGFDE